MGYVFTPKEFEDGKIPSPADYQIAMEMLREGLTELFDNRIIYGANIHGSNFHSDGGVGSDVDVLVVTGHGCAEDRLSVLHNDIRGFTNVPVEFVPVPEYWASVGLHQLDLFYIKYIQTFCKDGIIGDDPIPMIKDREAWKNPSKEVSERLIGNLTKFSKQRSVLSMNYDEEYCDFLEKVVRQPIYSAIDVIRLKNGGDYPSKDGKPLSKKECCDLYAKEFPELVTEDLSIVYGARSKYRQFLRERQNKTTTDYLRLLQEMDRVYMNARKVIEINLDFVVSRQ